MANAIDNTNLEYLISKIKAAFWGKNETTQVSIDNAPTANSNNLVKSGGVYQSIIDASELLVVEVNYSQGQYDEMEGTIVSGTVAEIYEAYSNSRPVILRANVILDQDTTDTYYAQLAYSYDVEIENNQLVWGEFYFPIRSKRNKDILLCFIWSVNEEAQNPSTDPGISRIVNIELDEGYAKTIITTYAGIDYGYNYVRCDGLTDPNLSVKYVLPTPNVTIPSGAKVIATTDQMPSAPGTLNTSNVTAQTASSSEALSGTINLHKVAKTGTYSDLIGTPFKAGSSGSASVVHNHKNDGHPSTATGDYSLAFGIGSNATDTNAVALGSNSNASGHTSFAAIGGSASGTSSIAIGTGTYSQNYGEVAIGRYNVSSKASNTTGNAGNTAFSVGIGVNGGRSNAVQVMQNGDMYIKGIGSYNGTNTSASSTLQTVIGNIPSAVTESTVSGWGFTKNTGTVTGVSFNGTNATVANGIATITAPQQYIIEITESYDSTTDTSTYNVTSGTWSEILAAHSSGIPIILKVTFESGDISYIKNSYFIYEDGNFTEVYFNSTEGIYSSTYTIFEESGQLICDYLYDTAQYYLIRSEWSGTFNNHTEDRAYCSGLAYGARTSSDPYYVYYLPHVNGSITADSTHIVKTLATTDMIPTISVNIQTDKASDVKTASPKAVYDEVHPAVASAQPQGGFIPNILYNLGTITGTITFSLATPIDANIVNHYYWTFETGSTAPTITWPSGLTWYGGSAPAISASKHYEISIINNIAISMEV